jgi:hypothetical protein
MHPHRQNSKPVDDGTALAMQDIVGCDASNWSRAVKYWEAYACLPARPLEVPHVRGCDEMTGWS